MCINSMVYSVCYEFTKSNIGLPHALCNFISVS